MRMMRMMRTLLPFLAVAVAVAASAADPAAAQQHQRLIGACAEAAQRWFGDFEARTDMRWSEPRVDGTRTVGGEIHLETRAAHVACAFPPQGQGRRLIEFFVDGKDRLAELKHRPAGAGGRPSASGSGRVVEVVNVPANDVLNVRSGPGPSFDIVGALGNGAQVRELECTDVGASRWCRVRFLDDMGGGGWVNARYLRR